MKKQTKSIIISLVVVVILGAVLAFLLLNNPDKVTDEKDIESTAAELKDENPLLIENEESNISYIEISNESGTYTVIPVVSGDDIVYAIKDLETTAQVNTSMLANAASVFTKLEMKKEIGETDDLAQYGLDGSAKAVCKYKDGTEVELLIGTTPGESSGRYVYYDGKVYICTVNSLFVSGVEKLMVSASWEIESLTDERGNPYNQLDYVELTGSNYERDIAMHYDDDEVDFLLTSPVNCIGSVTMAENLSTALGAFSTNGTEKINPTDEELEAYGILSPFADAKFSINGEEHEICLGSRCDNGRYCTVNGDNTVVYTVSDSLYTSWTDYTEINFRDGFVQLRPIYAVNAYDVTVGDKTIEATFSREPKDDNTYDYSAKLYGKDIEYETVRKFYASTIGIPLLNMAELEKEGEPVITIHYSYYDGSDKATTVEYYKTKDADNRYVAYLDGSYTATVRDTSVQEYLDSFDAFVEANG